MHDDMPSTGRERTPTGPVVSHLNNRINMGGAENLVVHLANAHARSGHASHAIVMHGPGALSPRFDERVKVHYLHYQRASIRNPFKFIASIIEGYRLLSEVIEREGIEVLQTHMQDTNLWGFVLQLTGRCRTVFTVHSNRFINYESGTRLGKWTTYKAYRLMARSRGAMVAVSSRVKDSLQEQLGLSARDTDRIESINNGIPMPAPPAPGERERLRAEYDIGEDEIWVVAAGRFVEPKNFACLLRCAGRLRDRERTVKILIAGDGPQRGDLERLHRDLGLADTVAMPGNLDNLGRIMAAADIFAIPSLWEGLPLVLVEAMAAGLPIVGSRTRGIADIVTDEEQGLLSEVGDHEALGRSIERLAGDAELRQRLGASGADLARRNFDIKNVYARYLAVYERLGRA